MKFIVTIISLFVVNVLFAQKDSTCKHLKVISIKNYQNGYVIEGIDSSKSDTIYFISIKEQLKAKINYKKIRVGQYYTFKIKDVDRFNGMPTKVILNGYKIRLKPNVFIKREGRDGNTITTTQYFCKNATGLYLTESCTE